MFLWVDDTCHRLCSLSNETCGMEATAVWRVLSLKDICWWCEVESEECPLLCAHVCVCMHAGVCAYRCVCMCVCACVRACRVCVCFF